MTALTWREIESAPKDGSSILIYEADGNVWLVFWRVEQGGEEGYGTWTTGSISNFNATHWMPLPNPPNTNGERDGQSLEAISRGTHDRNSPSAGDHRPIKAGEGVAVAGNQRAHQRAEQGIRPLEEAGGAATERSSGEPVAAPAITECIHSDVLNKGEICPFCSPLPEPIAAGLWRNAEDQVLELAKVLQTIAEEPVNWNATDHHYYAGIVGRFQLLADGVLRASPPIAAGEEDSRAVWKDGVLMNCYDCGSPLDSEMRCPKCAPAIHEAVWIDGKPGYRIVIPPIAAGEELRILRSGLERIGKIANTDPWRTFDGMIQDMQLIDDICRGLNSDPIIPPPIAAGEECPKCQGTGDITKQSSCPLCSGSGEGDDGPDSICVSCWGTGEDPTGHGIPARCNICDATGKVSTPIAAGGGEETRGQKLAKQIEEMAPHVGMKFTPDPEKIAQFDKPSPSSSDLVERLRKRKEFFTNDGAHWLMSPMPDQDCAEAADTIADQEIWIEQLKAVIQRLEAEVETLRGDLLTGNSELLDQAEAENTALQSERDRLQRVLESAADAGIDGWKIARAALGGPNG
jgi:hypothetical protein